MTALMTADGIDVVENTGVTPNPGSAEAIEQGCTCAVLDNYYGRGFLISDDPEPQFWFRGDCPLHGVGSGWRNHQAEACLAIRHAVGSLYDDAEPA